MKTETKNIVETIARILIDSRQTLSAAESCTGGRISSAITSLAGCSEYYYGSVTSYSALIKESVLNVPSEIIDTKGVVSSECAEAMAEGVRKLFNTDYSVSTTGVAGPGGGDKNNPVGCVWIAVSSKSMTKSMKFQIPECEATSREENIKRFVDAALEFLLYFIHDCEKLQ